MMLAYATFISLNSIIWLSFWLGVAVLALAALASADEDIPLTHPLPLSRAKATHARAIVLVEVATALFVAGAAAFILNHLYRHFTRSGLHQVRTYLVEQVKPGDFVLDRSGYRFAFLRNPAVLSRGALPAGAFLGYTPWTQELPRRRAYSPFSSARIWVVDRYRLFAANEPFLLGHKMCAHGPYLVNDEKTFGAYRVIELQRLSQPTDRSLVEQSTTLPVKGCRIDSRTHQMIWAHPIDRGVLRIRVPASLIPSNQAQMAVTGGFLDGVAEWKRAPVCVKVLADGTAVGTKLFANQSGLQGSTFTLPAAKEIVLEITSPDVARRHFCVNATFLTQQNR
jgi:hypothetical protein